MPRRAWLTPALPPVSYHWQAVLVPDAFLLYTAPYDAIMRGALLSLAEARNWEQVSDSDMSVEETTEVFARVFDSFLKGYPVQPTGIIQSYAGGPLAPPGWLMCDGAQVSQAVYPLLYGVIGSLYGAAEEGYFRLPDLRDKCIVGAGQTYDLAEEGGEATHTLTVDEMPSHNHSLSLLQGAGFSGAGIEFKMLATSGTISTSYRGGGLSHNNLQPYLAMNYVIFTGSYPYA